MWACDAAAGADIRDLTQSSPCEAGGDDRPMLVQPIDPSAPTSTRSRTTPIGETTSSAPAERPGCRSGDTARDARKVLVPIGANMVVALDGTAREPAGGVARQRAAGRVGENECLPGP